jgi:HD-like signal output (HDOD) protein
MKATNEKFLLAIARIETFSAAPRILSRAMRLLRDPQSDLESIVTLVANDPALAADLIRCSNSAFYGHGSPVKTVGEAVQKIGFRETIRQLNLAIARVAAGRDLASYGISADNFWAESVFNGLFLFGLAELTNGADPDEAYTVGLLRFMGRLAIDQAVRDLGAGSANANEMSLTRWEEESVGLNQAQAGAMLLAKWQFSEDMVEAVAKQDSPADAPGNWLAEGLHFATMLLPREPGAAFRPSPAAATAIPPTGREFMRRNRLTQQTVEALLASTLKSFEQVRGAFGRRH